MHSSSGANVWATASIPVWTSSKTKWQQKMLMKTSAEETVWIVCLFPVWQSSRRAYAANCSPPPGYKDFLWASSFPATECADTEQVFNTSLPHQLHIWTSLPCVRVPYSFWECTICINVYIIHLKLTKLFNFPFGLFSIVTLEHTL